jgi:hypothetical protein
MLLQGRLEVLKIHAAPITKHGDIDYEAICKLADGFNAADLRNVCTEAVCNLSWHVPMCPIDIGSTGNVCHPRGEGLCDRGGFHEGCSQDGRSEEAGGNSGV